MMNLIETNLFVVGKNIIELIIVYNKFTKCSNRSFAWSIRRNVRRPISADPFCLQSVQRGRAFCVTTTIEFSLVHASCCLCCERLDSFLLLLFGFIVGILCVQMVHLDLSTSVQCHWLLGRQDKTEQWTQNATICAIMYFEARTYMKLHIFIHNICITLFNFFFKNSASVAVSTNYRNRLSIVLTYACMRWRNRLENQHTIRLGLQRAYVQCLCVCKSHSHVDERKIHMRRASLFSLLLPNDALHHTRSLAHTRSLYLCLSLQFTHKCIESKFVNKFRRASTLAPAYFHLLLLATFDGIESNKFYFEFDAYNFSSSAQNAYDVCLFSTYMK